MAKLIKPCPFCGSKAALICFNFEYGTVTVGCTNEDCDITMGKGFFSDDEAVDHWNRRANESEIRAKTYDRFAAIVKVKAELDWCYNFASATDTRDFIKEIDEITKQLKECE